MTNRATDAFRGFGDREIADSLAATWASRREQIELVSTPVREWMLRELKPGLRDTILELAAGTGDTGFDAALSVGESGRLISSDFSTIMIAEARRRAAERGITNVDFRVIDAASIDLDDASVDGVICRFGYMLMNDPAAALAETRRVLRPHGRLVLAVFGAPERNPFFMTVAMSLVQRGHMAPPEPPPAPGIFSMASPQRTEQLLRDAGFDQVRTDEVPLRFPVPSADEYVAFIADTAGPLAVAVRGLSEGDRATVAHDVEDALRRFRSGDGYDVPGVALCAVAS